MDLKTFKAGVEYLAKSTNQRKAEPEPFLMQVGKDGSLSLISGEGRRYYQWKIPVQFRHDNPRKEGIQSKLLVQAMKMLKGNKLTVELFPLNDHLELRTSTGGIVRLPYVDLPDIKPTRVAEPLSVVLLDEGRLSGLARAFEATADGAMTRGIHFHPTPFGITVISTEEHKAYHTRIAATFDDWNQAYHIATDVGFWNPLSKFTSPATLLFYESGLRVRVDGFEAFTPYSTLPEVYDIRAKYFPDGKPPAIYAVTDRKQLMTAIKGVTPDDKNGTVDISLAAEGKLFLSAGTQHIGLALKKHKGWGRIGISAEYLSDVLGAMSGKDAILAWTEAASAPIGIKDASLQGDTFIIAPRVQA